MTKVNEIQLPAKEQLLAFKSLRNSDLISRTASQFSLNARSSQWLQAESLNHYFQFRINNWAFFRETTSGWNSIILIYYVQLIFSCVVLSDSKQKIKKRWSNNFALHFKADHHCLQRFLPEVINFKMLKSDVIRACA